MTAAERIADIREYHEGECVPNCAGCFLLARLAAAEEVVEAARDDHHSDCGCTDSDPNRRHACLLGRALAKYDADGVATHCQSTYGDGTYRCDKTGPHTTHGGYPSGDYRDWNDEEADE